MAYFRAGQIRNLPLSDDRASARRVLDLARDRDGSIWATTNNGVSRINNGRVATLTTANGLPCNTVHWIIEDDLSSYWLYAQCGLLRVARADMDSWIADPKRAIRPTQFGVEDGVRLVPILKGLRPAVTKASDGRIWFVNGVKVSFIDPSRVTLNTLPPPVHIEQITGDGITYEARPGLRLPPQVRNLQIDYNALSLVVPGNVKFRVMLEGQDKGWLEVVNQRHVQYTNLAPGNYRFRVLACNNSGVWNEQGASLEFVIPPAWYQTNWFRAACIAAFLAMIWGMYELRVRQLAAQFSMRLEERVSERTRIARELHDTLLQSFSGLLLRFRTAHSLWSKRPEEARQILESAIGDAREALTEGRQAVQGLRPSALEKHELIEAIQALTEELANDPSHGGGAEVHLSFEGTPRRKRPLIRDEIYRIASEALRNAFRHAEARRIEVQLSYNAKSFELRVRDDGKGIDPKLLSDEGLPGHFGLRGMRERAQEIGGKFTVWSAPGSGTEIELSIPAAWAYAESAAARRAWFGAKPAEKSSQRES